MVRSKMKNYINLDNTQMYVIEKLHKGRYSDRQHHIGLCGQSYHILQSTSFVHIHEICLYKTHPVKGHATHLL